MDRLLGGLKTDNLSRVLESQSSMTLPVVIAINWLHGDQTTQRYGAVTLTLAVHESHEAGAPATTLAPGEYICWLYSFQIIDDLGAS